MASRVLAYVLYENRTRKAFSSTYMVHGTPWVVHHRSLPNSGSLNHHQPPLAHTTPNGTHTATHIVHILAEAEHAKLLASFGFLDLCC